MTKPSTPRYKFRNKDNIGAASAEEDGNFLFECFVDTGEVETLRNLEDPRRIVLGRTGAGKSALLRMFVRNQPRMLEMKPEGLALGYVSNSNILQFAMGLGVNLDVFFKLLWRHVFTVEILKARFHLYSEEDSRSIWEQIREFFGGKPASEHRQALDYLRRWGETFWQETDYRIKETTTKLEHDIQHSVGAAGKGLDVKFGSNVRLSEEQKQELVRRCQEVVNGVQIRELSQVLKLLDEVLDDPQKPYYIVIDGLDENWVDEHLRLRLIRALIETVRDFRSVRHAKIVVALRRDLLERVFRNTRDSGFQEEKYESLYLDIAWTKASLRNLVDRRVGHLMREYYTSRGATFDDIFPPNVDGKTSFEYVLDRTLMRPRDVIFFVNACIARAAELDRTVVSKEVLQEAEGNYSRGRLRSLADEWSADFPALLDVVELLKRRPSTFRADELTHVDLNELCLRLATNGQLNGSDELSASIRRAADNVLTAEEFRRHLLATFYRVSVVGLKVEGYERASWSFVEKRTVSSSEIRDETLVLVHPMLYRALGIVSRVRSPHSEPPPAKVRRPRT